MLQILGGIVGFVAVAAWIVAAVSLFRAITLVPKGKRLSALFASGWWQFEKVRELGGPEVDTHLQRYAWAFGGFFFAIVGLMIVGILSMAFTNRSEVALRAPAIQTTSASLES